MHDRHSPIEFYPAGIVLSAQGWSLLATTLGFRSFKTVYPVGVESHLRRVHSATMPQSLAKVLIHGVFSTKDREPYLSEPRLRQEMHCILEGILGKLSCQPIVVGGVEDHVHLLFALSRTMEIAEDMKELKRQSSLWVKDRDAGMAGFAWQSGYGVFSIGFSQIPAVRTYILDQENHHRKISFQDEYRSLLQKYEIEFDERYVWD
jgi:REP element-mobilizing transposase RayT